MSKITMGMEDILLILTMVIILIIVTWVHIIDALISIKNKFFKKK